MPELPESRLPDQFLQSASHHVSIDRSSSQAARVNAAQTAQSPSANLPLLGRGPISSNPPDSASLRKLRSKIIGESLYRGVHANDGRQ